MFQSDEKSVAWISFVWKKCWNFRHISNSASLQFDFSKFLAMASLDYHDDDVRVDLDDLEEVRELEADLLPRQTVLDRENPLEALREKDFR